MIAQFQVWAKERSLLVAVCHNPDSKRITVTVSLEQFLIKIAKFCFFLLEVLRQQLKIALERVKLVDLGVLLVRLTYLNAIEFKISF